MDTNEWYQIANRECNAPKGWEEIAQQSENKVLVFGELHGTVEAPDFFSRYVYAASQKKGVTYVFVEYPASLVGDTFEKAKTAPNPRKFILENAPRIWNFNDGRDSQAMLDMLVGILSLDNVRVFPYLEDPDFTPPEGMETSEEIEVWRKALTDTPEKLQNFVEELHAKGINKRIGKADRYIVLVGNIHARKAPTIGFLEGVVYMAGRLDAEVISLNLLHEGGSYRNHETKVSASTPTSDNILSTISVDSEIGLFDTLLPAYDGYFYVKRIHPSPKAKIIE